MLVSLGFFGTLTVMGDSTWDFFNVGFDPSLLSVHEGEDVKWHESEW